jgi:D-aminopeptidase
MRTRDCGIVVGVLPTGPQNAIADVPGVRVGHCTVSWGGPELASGNGPARTGVTAILPHEGDIFHERVVAGVHVANGVGELVGSLAIREWGLIETPILLTSSQAIGLVCDTTVRWMMARDERVGVEDACIPVVGECDDSLLNDARGMHVRQEHVCAALDEAASSAAPGPVREGCVGAGTGMTCYDFKGGIGTSSRVVSAYGQPCTVGVLALCNFGNRARLTMAGVPVGRMLADLMPEMPDVRPAGHVEGSCIVVAATDAPLSARQCARIAKRCSLGLAVTGSVASDGSGEIMLAFSTAARVSRTTSAPLELASIGNDAIDPLFEAAVDATAESVCNALCSAETTVGCLGITVHALPLARVRRLVAGASSLAGAAEAAEQ